MIVETLSALYPGVPIMAEETLSAGNPGTHEWMWCVDPLDGTVNFSYGHPFFATSIALLRRGRPVAGMVHMPRMAETFWAVLGGGAYRNGHRIRVGRARSISRALLSTGFPYIRNEAFRLNLRGMNRLLPKARDFRRTGAASLDLAFVACGRLDGYFEAGLFPWDVAAGALVVTEAGGKVTDWKGEPDWLTGRRIVASNAALHPQILRRVGRP